MVKTNEGEYKYAGHSNMQKNNNVTCNVNKNGYIYTGLNEQVDNGQVDTISYYGNSTH